MWLFSQTGLTNGMRIAHVLFAVMWMGLLWFFNYIQTPAYNEMSGPAKNEAFDKVTWRALWWFRWAAMFTWASGLLIILIAGMDEGGYGSDFWKSPSGMGLATAILFATIMLYNVWMVIWPNQQIVIGNARNVLAGQEADPAAAGAARKAAMASRQNAIFSWAVFMFMVGTSHVFTGSHWDFAPGGGVRIVWWIVVFAIAALMEANALGFLGGTGTGGTRVIYDTHQNAIYTAAGLMVFLYLLAEILLRA